MQYDNDLIAGKLRRWEKYLLDYELPEWEAIPDMGLYMEQVITLLKEYLDYLPPELKEEQFITATTINNYVRKKIIPQPIKKKYYRVHIAFLIIVCTLKHCLSIPTLQTMIPVDMPEDELRSFYTSYAQRHRIASRYFIKQVKIVSAGILERNSKAEISTDSTEELVTTSAVVCGLARLLSEKLLLLGGKSLENGDSIELSDEE